MFGRLLILKECILSIMSPQAHGQGKGALDVQGSPYLLCSIRIEQSTPTHIVNATLKAICVASTAMQDCFEGAQGSGTRFLLLPDLTERHASH